MKINVGIVGYGNLGKAAEKCVLENKNLNLVAIFSRRLITSVSNTPVEPYERFRDYAGKIDVMLLCGGSKSDLEVQTPEVLEHFDCINTFDTHKRLASEFEKLDKIAKETNHRLIMACGWDPGIFSVIRAYDYAFSGGLPVTFWGKGVSMGHSDAIRRIAGVTDAVQFTVPVTEAVSLAKKGKLPADMPMHRRECYVVADPKEQTRIEREIKDMPNYFKGQPTTVKFVGSNEIQRLRANMSHKGQIISAFRTIHGSDCKINFSVSMKSNPNFTATIVTSYIAAIENLRRHGATGAFTNLDIPVSFLFNESERAGLISKLC